MSTSGLEPRVLKFKSALIAPFLPREMCPVLHRHSNEDEDVLKDSVAGQQTLFHPRPLWKTVSVHSEMDSRDQRRMILKWNRHLQFPSDESVTSSDEPTEGSVH